MENGVLVALISKMVDQRLAALVPVPGHRGPRGRAGLPGADGQGFVFSEHESTIRQWVNDLSLKFEDFTAEHIEALRGPRGRDGVAGKDFVFAEHEDKIRSWASEFALKFEDFTAEQIEAVRGPRGRDGAAGSDGKDFAFAEHSADIQALIKQAVTDSSESLKLKFADLSADEIEAIRGRRGEQGRSFIFEENKDAIESIIIKSVDTIRENLKLRFEDLNDDDIERIRGPRGRDGRNGLNGRDFVFDEHKEFFQGLKPKFSDFTAEERETLRLHFSQLTDEEKSELKLRFQDLTEDDRALIRGARGPKGQKGRPGNDGERGPAGVQGPRGLPGARGISGLPGARGKDGIGNDGVDGKDAPFVTDIELVEHPIRNEIAFEFHFSDGSTITTDTVKLPQHTNLYIESTAGGGGGGQGGGSVPVQDEGTEIIAAPTALNFVGPGVSVSDIGGVATITIPGGGGGGGTGGEVTAGPFAITEGQAATNLTGEYYNSLVHDQVDIVARIKRGTTVLCRQTMSLFFRDGAWELVLGEDRFSSIDHGVTFDADPITGQITAAVATDGLGDGNITFQKIMWALNDTTYHDLTDGQVATELDGEIYDSGAYTEVDFVARIVRGTTVVARQEFTIFFRNGSWELVYGEGRFTIGHGVSFTVDSSTGQLSAAADTGAGDGTVTVQHKTFLAA